MALQSEDGRRPHHVLIPHVPTTRLMRATLVLVWIALCLSACSKQAIDADRVLAVTPTPGGTASVRPAPAASLQADSGTQCSEATCPLHHWMKKNASKAMREELPDPLEEVFAQIANMAPDAGFPHWASISRDGARAARAGQYDAAKAACRACHDQYKDKYKRDLRTRAP